MNLVKKLFKKKELLVIAFIFASSFLVRWYGINSLPYGIEGDEFSWAITSSFNQYKIPAEEKGIWSMHTDMSKSFPSSMFINKVGFDLFGQDILSTRKILIIVSTISIIIFYLFCRSFFSIFISLIITLFYSFSYYKLISTRIAMAPAYIDIFLLFSFFCLFKSFLIKSKFKYLFACFAGSGVVLSLFTCNIAYLVLIISIGYILFQFFNNKISKKQYLIIVIIFLFPIIITSSKWFYEFKLEKARKPYALFHVVFDLGEKKFYPFRLQENLKIINAQLLNGLTYETSDMLVNYNSPLISKSITILAIFGLIIALFNIKKYFFIILWFICSMFINIGFGLFLPRMWVVSVGSFFLLAGIGLSFFEAKTTKKYFVLIYYTILFIFCLMYIRSNLNIYFTKALYNPSYLSKHKEIIDLVKKHKKDIPSKIIFISTPDFNHGVIYPTVIFYFLANNPQSRSIVLNSEENDLQIFNENDIDTEFMTNISSIKYIIVDNLLMNNSNIKNKLDDINNKILEQKSYKNFTEIRLN